MIKKLAELKKLSSNTGSGKSNLSMAIVNTENCGKRIRISPALIKLLNNPKRIDILLNEANTGVYLAASEAGMTLNKGGNIYNSDLVQTLTSIFGIDFSACTSQSFSEINILEEDNQKYAEVILNPAANHSTVTTAINSSEITNTSNTDNEKEAR